MSNVPIGVLLALGTSACWALGNVLTQKTGRLVGPPRAMLWSMAAGGVLAAPLALLLDERTAPVTPAGAAYVAIAAVSGVVAYVGLFFAFASESLTVAVPIVSSWPVVTAAVSFVLFGERVARETLGGAAVVLLGVVLVSLGSQRADAPRHDAHASRRALAAGLASAVGFGVMIPAMAHVAPATGAFGATAAVYALGVVLGGIGARALGVDVRPPPRGTLTLVLATGAVESLGFVCVNLARKFAPMTVVAPVATLSSTFTVIAAWAFLKERPGPRVLAGAALACAGVVMLAR